MLAVGAVLAKEVADKVAAAVAIAVSVPVPVPVAGAGAGAATLAGAMTRGGAAVMAARRDREAFGKGLGEEGHGVFFLRFFLCMYLSSGGWA